MSAKSVVSVERVVDAPPEAIFALLADPARHPDLDGSGSVRRARPQGPARLTLGSRFAMDMRVGVPYRVSNTVSEFEQDRRIAWHHFAGHTWRWILEPLDGGTRTRVTEQFDATTSRVPWLVARVGALQGNRQGMEKSLERLAGLVAPAR